MTSLPPPGWYPDPNTGGRSWRWWDGGQWAAPSPPVYYHDPARAARAREQSIRYAGWLRYAMIANALSSVLFLGLIAIVLHGRSESFLAGPGDGSAHFSGPFVALQLASLPLSLLGLGFTAVLIAWIYHAGEHAAAMGWPSVRGRTLGAFSILIPIVNLWWPYEAIRDAYPPGADRRPLLRWWLAYLIVPGSTSLVVFVVAFVGTATVVECTLLVAAVCSTIPVILGWRVLDDFAGAVSGRPAVR